MDEWVGLVLGLLSLPFVYSGCKRVGVAIRRAYARRSDVGEQFSEKRLNALRQHRVDALRPQEDFGIALWRHVVVVDDEGGATHEVDCSVTNLTTSDLSSIEFPYYSDGTGLSNAWASVDGEEVTPQHREYAAAGHHWIIPLWKPVPAAESCRIKWGFSDAGVFSVGEEWFEWLIARPHASFELVMRFSAGWQIRDVRGLAVPPTWTPPQPKGRRNRIAWKMAFPRTLHQLRVEFYLESVTR